MRCGYFSFTVRLGIGFRTTQGPSKRAISPMLFEKSLTTLAMKTNYQP
jgi:hypothetical protein